MPQDVEHAKRIGNGTRQTHHDELGMRLVGDGHELLDHHGGAVVEVGGVGEIEDDDFMVPDVGADHVDQPVGGGDGEAPPERHHADARRIGVRRGGSFSSGEEGPIQQRHRDHAVEFQVLQLPGVGHSRGDQPDRHRGYQVDEHREGQGRQHDEEVFAPDAVRPGEKTPVDDVPGDPHQDARQRRERNRFDVSTEAEHHQGEQNDRPQRARCPGPSAGSDVDHRARGAPGAGQSAEQAGGHVADALADQFPIRLVATPGQRVGHEGGQEAVDRTEQGEDQRRLQRIEQEAGGRQPQLHPRQAVGRPPVGVSKP